MVMNRPLAYLQDDRQLDSSDGDQPSSSLFTGRTVGQLDSSDGDQPSCSSSTGRKSTCSSPLPTPLAKRQCFRTIDNMACDCPVSVTHLGHLHQRCKGPLSPHSGTCSPLTATFPHRSPFLNVKKTSGQDVPLSIYS
ncbi:hypothetical protein RRG08_001561 [Elysia crispata]|uniref:Uncharacterized protein n=1 Tax=Elysia crispata TaxID=231223 RepID=A0AAE1AJP0_9GAST|nr:hypothetical protein RRG08_001561 [Elysia crispata]